MQKFRLVLIILLPSILCVSVIYFTKVPLEYSTLSFGLIIGLTNWNIHKHKPILGILLSMLVSFISFLIAYFSFAITGNLFNFIAGDSGNVLGLIISTYIIAPLLVFYLFRFVFQIEYKTKLTILVICFSIGLLILQSYLFVKFPKIETNAFNPLSMWQIIVALALQLIVYQKCLLKQFI